MARICNPCHVSVAIYRRIAVRDGVRRNATPGVPPFLPKRPPPTAANPLEPSVRSLLIIQCQFVQLPRLESDLKAMLIRDPVPSTPLPHLRSVLLSNLRFTLADPRTYCFTITNIPAGYVWFLWNGSIFFIICTKYTDNTFFIFV